MANHRFGRHGTFVLQGSEIVENGKIKATWFVVPGSATGDLSGLRGEGGFEGHFGKGSAGSLDYWFERCSYANGSALAEPVVIDGENRPDLDGSFRACAWSSGDELNHLVHAARFDYRKAGQWHPRICECAGDRFCLAIPGRHGDHVCFHSRHQRASFSQFIVLSKQSRLLVFAQCLPVLFVAIGQTEELHRFSPVRLDAEHFWNEMSTTIIRSAIMWIRRRLSMHSTRNGAMLP
jgi:hypothetical protein